MAGRDIFRGVADLPFRRFVLAQMARATRLARKLGMTAIGFDQYPGKLQPASFGNWYGPIALQSPGDAPTLYMPRDTNPLTGHDYSFHWGASNLAAYLQWTNSAVTPGALGDLFDPAVLARGGGIVVQNFSQALPGPRICFEVELYDRKRGRSITDGRIPGEVFLGLAYDQKHEYGDMVWGPDTEIEPRIYVTEASVTADNGHVAFWINLGFFGFFSYDAHPSGAELGTEIDEEA